MSVDEQEPRRCAEQACAPLFAAEELARQVGWHRSRVFTTVADAVMAGAAVAVAIPIALSTGCRLPVGHRRPRSPRLSYVVVVDGKAQVHPEREPGAPWYSVVPGEALSVTVEVTVPGDATVTALWFGIMDGLLTVSRGGPTRMSPVLVAHPDTMLDPGAHRFDFRWDVPADLRPEDRCYLAAQFGLGRQSQLTSHQIVAVFEALPSPGA